MTLSKESNLCVVCGKREAWKGYSICGKCPLIKIPKEVGLFVNIK